MEIEPSFAFARRLGRVRPRASPSLVTVCLIVLFALSEPGVSQSQPEADVYRWIRPAVVNLRAGGGTQFETIDQLRRGDRVWLVFVDQGWAKVQIQKDPERAHWGLFVVIPSIGGAENAACFSYSLLDADRWEMHRADIAQMLSSPGVARWWGVGPESPIEDLRARPTHYSPEFVAPVEEILGEQADRGE